MNEFVSFNVLDPDYIKDKVDEEQIIRGLQSKEDIQLEQIELQVQTDEEVASITNKEEEQPLSDMETKFLEVVDKIVEQEKETIIPDKIEGEKVD